MKANDIELLATITDECKKEIGNEGNLYDGIWRVSQLDFRNENIELSNGRISISRKFSEVDILTTEQLQSILNN